jgi:tetratricopeptide (TPR) repeat protein
MPDRIQALWDFDDLDASERRFREELEREPSQPGRAELLTQLARVAGLRGSFGDADALLDEAEALAGCRGAARARLLLERGRVRRSAGSPEEALPLFEAAFAEAERAETWFLAGDAAHMAALAAPDPAAMAAWTERGLALAGRSPDAAYWAGPLLNNLGWARAEAGDHAAALEAFEDALAARERDPGRPYEIAIARYAVGKALRTIGRAAEAARELEQAVAWAASAGVRDGWFHEELAEDFAALGRRDDARPHALLALELLADADPGFEADGRAERLRALAG